jgi:hypothetical protein
MVTSSTKVVLADGVTVITDGDNGIVKVRAPKQPKDVSASDLATLLTVDACPPSHRSGRLELRPAPPPSSERRNVCGLRCARSCLIEKATAGPG